MRGRLWKCVAALCVTLSSSSVIADFIAVADRLVAAQLPTGQWPGEEPFTGSIAAGLIRAYEMTGKAAYRDAAVAAGTFMVSYEMGNYYGDSAYALSRLSTISPDPENNLWRDELETFYDVTWGGYAQWYIDWMVANAPNGDMYLPTFYVAHHTLASSYVNAFEEDVWRDGLMDILGTVTDDSATCPVQSLALGVWALTKTGSSALIPDLGVSSPLAGMTLTQLTEFLLSQQVPAGEPGAGSFYWRFDHAGPDGSDLDPDNAAFTEDLTYSVLALMSAYDATGDPRYSIAADLGRNVFTSGVDEDGTVYAHIPPGEECPSYYVYAGGGLQIMTPEPGTLALFVMGSLALARRRRRRRASPNA